MARCPSFAVENNEEKSVGSRKFQDLQKLKNKLGEEQVTISPSLPPNMSNIIRMKNVYVGGWGRVVRGEDSLYRKPGTILKTNMMYSNSVGF